MSPSPQLSVPLAWAESSRPRARLEAEGYGAWPVSQRLRFRWHDISSRELLGLLSLLLLSIKAS